MPPPLLDVRDLRVSLGGRELVHGIDFSLNAGEKLAIVGESGSGKTITALSLLRLLPQARVTGSVRLQGVELGELDEPGLRALRGGAVAYVFQEPMSALNPLLTLGDQIAEVLQLHKGLTGAQAAARVLEQIAAVGLPDPVAKARAYPHQLSGGQRQRALIAMALASEPRLLVADEPTTALDAHLRLQMLALLDEMRQRLGLAVLIITHDLHLVRRFADRVLVMRDGRVVEQGAVDRLFAAPSQPYTRTLLDSLPRRDLPPDAALQSQGSPPSLVIEALRVSYPVPLPGWRGWFRRGSSLVIDGIDLCLPPGRTLGVVGESGSGKSTLALAVLGLLPHQGHLSVLGQSWDGRQGGALRQLRRRVQVVFQDPYSSLSPRLTLEQIVGEGLRVHEPALPAAARRARVLDALREVGLLAGLSPAEEPSWLQRYPHEFSGGQRQRIAIARALIVQPELIVLDEPTSALDVTVQQQVLALLLRLQRERGLSYLLITHDLAVVWAMAHQVAVLRAGRLVEQGPAESVLRTPRTPYATTLIQASGL
ncbi:ABC transporter ATP-binding protein [Malikia sp.]|uniref:ABC transporter ATP-binding protein n=1 Tax=Malikia sp. TaxID=2070706 RepID=UPI0026217F07|nr:dipeptide ABC transporter ATP-binding protein [Malikia sp.]MDD2729715.1 dipeptide ABC transporter ATP-binding protein [Malikia sp.]